MTTGNEHAEHVSGEDLHELLMATRLKYTAGRYLRAGMVHILPEILRKYSNSIDQGRGVGELHGTAARRRRPARCCGSVEMAADMPTTLDSA